MKKKNLVPTFRFRSGSDYLIPLLIRGPNLTPVWILARFLSPRTESRAHPTFFPKHRASRGRRSTVEENLSCGRNRCLARPNLRQTPSDAFQISGSSGLKVLLDGSPSSPTSPMFGEMSGEPDKSPSANSPIISSGSETWLLQVLNLVCILQSCMLIFPVVPALLTVPSAYFFFSIVVLAVTNNDASIKIRIILVPWRKF